MKKIFKFLEGRSLPSLQKTTKPMLLFIFLLFCGNINAQSFRIFPYQNISEDAERIYTVIGEKFTTIFNEKENSWIMQSNNANTIDITVIDNLGNISKYNGLLKLEIVYNENNEISAVLIDKHAFFADGRITGPHQLILMDVKTINITGGL